jgi:hypothetical protein
MNVRFFKIIFHIFKGVIMSIEKNVEEKKVPVRKVEGVYQNVSVYVPRECLSYVRANTQFWIPEHHHSSVLIPNATKGEKRIVLNEHYYNLIPSDVDRSINARVIVTKKIVNGNKEYLSVDIRKTPGKSESVYVLNIGRPELIADVQIPYTNTGICIVPKSVNVGYYTNVSRRVLCDDRLRFEPANAVRGTEYHFHNRVYLANSRNGQEPVKVDLRYYGMSKEDVGLRTNFNVSIVVHTAWDGHQYLEVIFRKARGSSENYFKINTRSTELGGDVQIPDANAFICIVPNTEKGESEYLAALESAAQRKVAA